MKKISIIIISILLGFLFLIISTNLKSFNGLISKSLNENSVIRDATITQHEPYKGDYSTSVTEPIAQATIEDEELIKEMIESFSNIWLLREVNTRTPWIGEFSLELLVSNETKPGIITTNRVTISYDDNRRIAIYAEKSGRYFVLNNSKHYETIKELLDGIEWEYVGE